MACFCSCAFSNTFDFIKIYLTMDNGYTDLSNGTTNLNTTSSFVEESNFTNTTLSTGLSVSPSVGLTKVELWIQCIVFYGLLAGVFSFIGNVLVAIGIVRSKNLRSRFFVILWFLVVTRALFSFQLGVMAVYRSLRTLNIVDTNIKRASCYLIHLNAYYALTLEMVLLLGLVIDRTLAIAMYNYYRTLTIRHAIIACLAASAMTTILKMVPSFFDINFNTVIPCLNAYSVPTKTYVIYHQNIDLAISVLILILYICLLSFVHIRLMPKVRSMRRESDDQSWLIAFQRQMKLLPLLRRLILIHCGFALASKIVLSMTGFVPEEVGLRFTAYGGMMVTVDLFVNVVMILMSDKEVREASLPGFSASVAPAGHSGASPPRIEMGQRGDAVVY